MSTDSQTSSLSRELTILLPEAEYEQTLTILKEYTVTIGDVSVLADSDYPTLPDEICDIFSQISNDARILYPWKYLYSVVIVRFREVLSSFDTVAPEYTEDQSSMLRHIDSLLVNRFQYAPPFTIQRICDLLSEAKKYYTVRVKFTRAFEKVLNVISYARVHCVSPLLPSASPKFSPPAKRMKHEASTASTVIISGDSTASSERNSIVLPLSSFTEISLPQLDIAKDKDTEKASDSPPPEPEQDTECSVSEADSTTLNGARTSQDENEAEDGTCQKTKVPSKTGESDS